MGRAEAQIAENGRQIAALTEALREFREATDRRFAAAEAQIAENSRQIAALTEALREFREAAERRFAAAEAQIAENSRQIAALAEQVRENGVRMGRLEERWGLVHEDIAGELMPRFLEEKGHRVIRRVPMAFDGEVDLVMEVEVRGATRTLAVEVKGRVYGRGPFEGILRKVGDPRFRERLLREGFSGHIVPAVFGLRVYSGAAETAGELRVGLYDAGRGTVVEPDWGVP
jgi:Holliday junction resolvase-like predicted endonuclease